VRCLDESWALNDEREGKDGGRLAPAGFAYGGAQAILRAASRLRYLQYETIGGRQASRDRMEVGVERKVGRCPSLDSVPEAVHASERGVRRGEEVGDIHKYGAEETGGDTVIEKGSHARSWGEETLDEGEDGLGQRKHVPEMVCGGEGRVKPVSQLSNNLGGVKKVALQSDRGR